LIDVKNLTSAFEFLILDSPMQLSEKMIISSKPSIKNGNSFSRKVSAVP
jgi:hypothetical protein